jgi:ABC-2 type transport system ATP-binding protein
MGRCPLIEAQGLTKRCGGRAAVADLTFTARSGEVLGLLGLEGAGKSTTLRLLAGGLLPDSGTATVAGYDAASREARRRVGCVAQGAPVFDDMRVESYLAAMARLRGVRPRPGVDLALEACGLTACRRSAIAALSPVDRRRVAVAGAVVHEPAVLLLDEPSAGLGPDAADEVRALVALVLRGRTAVLAGRDRSGLGACDRVLVLRAGALVGDEAPAALDDRPARRRVTAVVGGDRAEIERRARALEGVTDVKLSAMGGGDHRLTVSGDREDLQDAVARMVIGAGLALKELHLARERTE